MCDTKGCGILRGAGAGWAEWRLAGRAGKRALGAAGLTSPAGLEVEALEQSAQHSPVLVSRASLPVRGGRHHCSSLPQFP